MELLNPKITVQNTDQHFWLVRMQHAASDVELIDITLKVPRCDDSLPQLQTRLLGQAIDLLTQMQRAG